MDPMLAELMHEFDALPANRQDELLTALRGAYANPASDRYCERLQCVLQEPCGMTTCPMYVDNVQHLNCKYVYRNAEGDPDLNLHQLAGITEDSEHGVRAILSHILTKMRREALRGAIAHADVNRFRYVYGTRVCPCCNTKITRQYTNPQLVFRGLEWCSRECKNEKPEWIIAAEHTYGTDILSVMFHAHRMFPGKLGIIAGILRARKKPLLMMYQEHFRISPSSFGAEALDVWDILRSTHPMDTWGFGATQLEGITHPKLRRILDRTNKLIAEL